MKRGNYMRHRSISIVLCIAFISLVAYCTRDHFLWIPWNPAYSPSALIGRSPEEVVKQLGPPSFDPRSRTPIWDEDANGPLYLGYYGQFGATCTIVFKDGKVVEVRHTFK